jgi:hypothetical protein
MTAINDLTLEHYSRNSTPLDLAREHRRPWAPIDMKPNGLWVSVKGEFGWPEWCIGESWGTDTLRYRSIVKLVPDAPILMIENAAELDQFDETFGSPIIPHYRMIDWDRVAEFYQGIVITPYIWSRRLDGSCRWYYGWDCASGCIWDPAAIESVSEPERTYLKALRKRAMAI